MVVTKVVNTMDISTGASLRATTQRGMALTAASIEDSDCGLHQGGTDP